MERGVVPALLLLVGADAPDPGCFAAARPYRRLSLAAGAAVLPVDQQLTLLIAEGKYSSFSSCPGDRSTDSACIRMSCLFGRLTVKSSFGWR